jgi:hypothetical protein
MRETEKIIIPNGLGVTGHVLLNKEIHISNNMVKESRFMSDIDN